MAEICKFCGATLEENQLCGCEGAVAERGGANPQMHPFPQAQAQAQPEPSPVIQQQHQQAPPSAPPKMSAASNILNEIKDVSLGILKDPIKTAESSRKISMTSSLVMLGIQSLAFMFMMWVFNMRTMFFGLGSLSSMLGVKASVPIGAVLSGFLMMAVEIGLIYGSLLLFGLIFKSTITAKVMLSAVTVSSPLWSATFLAGMLFLLIFGATNAGIFFTVLPIMFSVVYSLFMLDAAIRAMAPAYVNRMLMIAVSYAVHFALFVAIASQIWVSMLGASLGSTYR